MENTQLAAKREIFGWSMFDFANQAYTLLIITVVYGDLFTRIIVGDAPDYRLGNLLWSGALALSYAMVVVANPVCGAVMDYSKRRKQFLFASYLLTVITTSLLYFIEPGWILPAIVLIVLSNFAYAMGEGFIASFLTDLGPRKSLGWISGLGWSVGYLGGMVATIVALLFLGEVSEENFENVRWVGPFAGIFFLVAAIPTFIWLTEKAPKRAKPQHESWSNIAKVRLMDTLSQMHRFNDLRWLLVSIFFSMAGIYIIIAFSFIYGAQVIGWEDHVRVLMFVIVQVTAAIGALGFGVLQTLKGARYIYMLTLWLWILAILAIWQTPSLTQLLNASLGVEWQAQYVFLVAGVLSGLSLGASQSSARALVGTLSPRTKAAEFFGFWGMASKLAAVFGILGLGLMQLAFGLADAIVFCLVLFIFAILTILPVNETRGIDTAVSWQEPSTRADAP